MLCAHWVQNARWPFLYRSSSSAVGNIIRSLALARMFLTCLMVDMEDLRSSRTCSSRAHSHRAPSPSSLFSWHLSSQFTVRLAFMFKGMNEITAARTKQLWLCLPLIYALLYNLLRGLFPSTAMEISRDLKIAHQ